MSAKKKVTYYVDLFPGWENCNYGPYLDRTPANPPGPGVSRFRVELEFPVLASPMESGAVELVEVGQ